MHSLAVVIGKRKNQIIAGCFTGVVRHHNRIYAANFRTSNVHVFEKEGEWNSVIIFPLTQEKALK